MSSAVHLGSTSLLPIKEAAEFVPYSRDYVARLAREGKIVAAQIDRQWFIDVASLQNFFTHATIEESVRKRQLSSSRKRDLEVKEVYRTQLAAIAKKHQLVRRTGLIHTCLILLCGLGTGVVFLAADHFSGPDRLLSLAQLTRVMMGVSSQASTATLVKSAQSNNPSDFKHLTVYDVEITDRKLDVKQGIVLLPAQSASSSNPVNLFSDPVTVEMSSDHSGVIRNTVSGEAIPFVQMPAYSTVATDDSNRATP